MPFVPLAKCHLAIALWGFGRCTEAALGVNGWVLTALTVLTSVFRPATAESPGSELPALVWSVEGTRIAGEHSTIPVRGWSAALSNGEHF